MNSDFFETLETFFDEQARIVCKWLRGKRPFESRGGMTRLCPHLGLVAFNRRCGQNSTPTVNVHPIAKEIPKSRESMQLKREHLRRLTKAPRPAGKVEHFQKHRVRSDAWGGFYVLGRVAELENDTDFAELLKVEDPKDEERNLLDLLYFDREEHIVSFPIPVFGSPLLTCYLPLVGGGLIPEDIIPDMERELRGPLTSFVTTNIVASLFVIGKELAIRFDEESEEKGFGELFLKIASELLFAKRATLNSRDLFEDSTPPLYDFPDGRRLQIGFSDKGPIKGLWEAVLPTFRLPEGGLSSDTTEVELLGDAVTALILHIVHFIGDAVTNRRKIREQAGLATKAKLFESIQKDFSAGIGQLRDAVLSLNRAESKMESSNSPFLRLYKDASLSLIFKTDSVCYYDETGTASGFAVAPLDGKRKALQTIHAPESGGPYYKRDGIYDPVAAWDAYKAAVEAFASAQDIEFLKNLEMAPDKNSAIRNLKALKQFFHRTHGDQLYDFSLIAHTSLALNAHGPNRPILTLQRDKRSDVLNHESFRELLSWADDEVLKEMNEARNWLHLFAGAERRPAVSVPGFLSAWMQLIGSELLALGRPKEVVCQGVMIRSEVKFVLLVADCRGALPDEALDLSGTPEAHGLRSCIRVLSDAVGQFNGPLQFGSTDSSAVANLAKATKYGWFGVGIGPADTKFFIQLNRKSSD